MAKQSKRIKPNSTPMINPQTAPQQGQQVDFTKMHIHFGIPC